MTTKKPTPTALMRIRGIFETAGFTPTTWVASTWTSGSAMVMKKPMAKAAPIRSRSFRFAVRAAPAFCPMGLIPRSAPTRNRVSPAMTSSEPARKRTRVADPTGAIVKLRRRTIAMMGTTEIQVSFSFTTIFIRRY